MSQAFAWVRKLHSVQPFERFITQISCFRCIYVFVTIRAWTRATEILHKHFHSQEHAENRICRSGRSIQACKMDNNHISSDKWHAPIGFAYSWDFKDGINRRGEHFSESSEILSFALGSPRYINGSRMYIPSKFYDSDVSQNTNN